MGNWRAGMGYSSVVGFFDGSVDGFAVFTVLPCRTLRAHVVAVLVG